MLQHLDLQGGLEGAGRDVTLQPRDTHRAKRVKGEKFEDQRGNVSASFHTRKQWNISTRNVRHLTCQVSSVGFCVPQHGSITRGQPQTVGACKKGCCFRGDFVPANPADSENGVIGLWPGRAYRIEDIGGECFIYC